MLTWASKYENKCTSSKVLHSFKVATRSWFIANQNTPRDWTNCYTDEPSSHNAPEEREDSINPIVRKILLAHRLIPHHAFSILLTQPLYPICPTHHRKSFELVTHCISCVTGYTRAREADPPTLPWTYLITRVQRDKHIHNLQLHTNIIHIYTRNAGAWSWPLTCS
jgi:hypothetical protein